MFGHDALVRLREEEAGLKYLPYYIGNINHDTLCSYCVHMAILMSTGKYLSNFLEILIFPIVFLLSYYTLVVPSGAIGQYYVMLMALQLSIYGICNLITVLVRPKSRVLIINGKITSFFT